jgi:hypothetical protein
MLVIESEDSFFTLGVRRPSTRDPIPSVWAGVEVYQVERCSGCWGLDSVVTPVPGVPFDPGEIDDYGRTLAHVIRVGNSMQIAGIDVTVTATSGSGYRVDIAGGGPHPRTGRFADVSSSHTFSGDIDWMAAAGITKGCNPPGNDRYCPDGPVTRGQMAAFLVRALALNDNGGGNRFVDDNGTTFENDIAKLAAAGITKGCNPPGNDRYCPDAPGTRGQMAAFLHRALTH